MPGTVPLDRCARLSGRVYGWRIPCLKRERAGYARLEEIVRAKATIILMRIIINIMHPEYPAII